MKMRHALDESVNVTGVHRGSKEAVLKSHGYKKTETPRENYHIWRHPSSKDESHVVVSGRGKGAFWYHRKENQRDPWKGVPEHSRGRRADQLDAHLKKFHGT